MDAILTDSHFDTRMKDSIKMILIVPKLENTTQVSTERERETRNTVGNNTDDSSSKTFMMLKYYLVIQY